MPIDLAEREYASRYSIPTFVLLVHKLGVLADADAAVTVTMVNEEDDSVIFTARAATKTATGTYEVALTSAETGAVGFFKLTWSFVLDSVAQTFVSYIEVGFTTQDYDALSTGFKGIVESVWIRFADLFDSPEGGPHLQVYYQTHFGRGRLAQLLRIAVGKLNTVAQPHMTYTVDENAKPFPYDQWGSLLEQSLYIETIKHLMRSYVEIPADSGIPVALLDRRDYLDRWGRILDIEQQEYKDAFGNFKIAHMGLGRPRVLVSGGVYGNWGPTRLPNAAAQPRFSYRFY